MRALRGFVCDRPLADTMAEAAHEQEALFDRDDFDAVDYVNQLFPTGAVQLCSCTRTPCYVFRLKRDALPGSLFEGAVALTHLLVSACVAPQRLRLWAWSLSSRS